MTDVSKLRNIDDDKQQKPRDELWMIRGDLYDLEDWKDKHPGGEWILSSTKGTDCTALFESYHTFANNKHEIGLKKCFVRRATTEERDGQISSSFDWDNVPKTRKLRSKVTTYFREKNLSPKAPWYILVLYAVYFVTFLVQGRSWLIDGSYSSAFLTGVSIWYFSGDMLHSGTHFAIFRGDINLKLGYWFGWLHNIPETWMHQHFFGHHVWVNIPGRDPDLYHFEAVSHFSQVFGYRLTETTAYKFMYKYWFLGMPIVVGLTGLGPLLLESTELLAYGTILREWIIPPAKSSLKGRAIALGHYFLVIGLLHYVFIRHGALIAILPFYVHGTLFFVFSQVSHANEESEDPEKERVTLSEFKTLQPRKVMLKPSKMEWIEHQFLTSKGDYSSSSSFWNVASLGLHLQSVHHAFPNIHWAHYPALYPIMCEVLDQEPTTKTFVSSVCDHVRFLGLINGGDTKEKVN